MDTVVTSTGQLSYETQIIAALVGLLSAGIIAVVSAQLTYKYTRKTRLEAEWRIDKLGQYRQLLSAFSAFANWRTEEDFDQAMRDLAHAVNTLSLVAPQAVLEKMTDAIESIKKMSIDSSSKADEHAKECIRQLALAIRRDLDILPKDDETAFKYELLAGRSQNTPRG